MSIIKKIFINTLIIFILSVTSSYAEEIKKIGKFKDWEALVLVKESEVVCFAQSKPVLQSPKSKKRLPVLMICQKRP